MTADPVAPAERTEALWRGLSADLRRFIARRVDPADVDDLLQTVFLRLHTRASSVLDDERLVGWLYTVTRNAITDHYRLASRRREVAVADFPTGDHPLTTDAVAVDEAWAHDAEKELAGCLLPMLEELPADQAAALRLVELDGLSQVAAAEVAGITTSGMKSRVQRGRSRLRQLLLDCCAVAQDPRGRVQDWEPRDASCACH